MLRYRTFWDFLGHFLKHLGDEMKVTHVGNSNREIDLTVTLIL